MNLADASKIVMAEAERLGWACSEGPPPWVTLPPDTAAWWLSRPVGDKEGHAVFQLRLSDIQRMSGAEVLQAFSLGASGSAITASAERAN